MKITYSREKTPMRTGGAIKYAENLIGWKEPFLVLNGDIFTNFDYIDILNTHKENDGIATIAIYKVDDPSRYGTVKLFEGNRVDQFVEKAPRAQAPSNLINAGVYVLDPKIFEYIPGGRPVSIEHEVFPRLAKEGKLFAHEFKGVWVDIGKPADYLRANKILLDEETKKTAPPKNVNLKNVKINQPIMIDVGVKVGYGSQVGPYTVIGKDVVLGENVILENSVVFSDVTISDNASITGAVIGQGVTIGCNTTIMEGSIIGDYVTVQDNLTISKNVNICHSKIVNESVSENTNLI
jgi:mannose-1-phosphate guanylyltransferase